jgi:polysaccharide biosynthesis transport protein
MTNNREKGMQGENKTKLIPVEEAAATLDRTRDYSYGRGPATESEGKVHLRDYWRIVRRRLWLPLSIVFVTVTLTTIYNLRLVSIYEGVSQIEVNQEDRLVNLNDMQLNMASGNDTQFINTQLKILQSPRIAMLVAKSLDLEHNNEFNPGMARPLSPQPESYELSSGESDEQAEMQRLEPFIATLLDNVEVKPERETSLLNIHYRHHLPELAAKIADTWAEAFKKNNLDQRFKENREAGSFLEKSIADSKLKLKEAEEKLLNYRKANQIIDLGEKENPTTLRYSALNELLMRAEAERKNAQLNYELSRSVADVSVLAEMQRDPLIHELNKKIAELRAQREQMLVEFMPEWPDVKKINHQIERLEGELRAAQQRILTMIDNHYQSALQREASARLAFDQHRAQAMHQSEGAIVAKILQQEANTNREMFERLLQTQQQIQVSGPLLKSNIRITKYSTLPRSPVAPRRAQNIILSGLLALIGGIGLVLFLDYINNKIETVEDIDRYLRLPALGVIPAVEIANKSRRLLGTGRSNNESVQIGKPSSIILSQVESNSSIAESYRQLRTSLLLSSAGHPPRTLLFTSSQPAEGKTTTSVNTAISLSQTGSAVLIIDADLRRPRVHKIFGIRNNAGLSNYLTGDADLSTMIQVVMPNLYVLPVGPLPPNPAEILGSAKMKQAIDTLAANFDFLIIDSPPVSSFADGLILSSMVEGVIIIVKGGVTPREMAQRTKEHLQAIGAKILGIVINQIKLQPHDYYYYSTYYSRYYYGTPDNEEAGEGAKAGA